MKRIFLFAGAIGWGVSILGVLLPWRIMNTILVNMGAVGPIADPQIQYWFRMATGAWSVIGFLFTAAFMFPRKYRNLIPLLAVGTLAEGFFLLIHGMLLRLPSLPFYGDVGFCLIVGFGLLFTGTNFGKIRYPLLAGRNSDASVWQLDDVDPRITAAYLEVISYAFDLNRARELFLLRPGDSLFDLYDSYYKTSRKTAFLLGTDNMELEECGVAFEKLCRCSGTAFDYKESLREQLRIIAECRNNRAPDAEELKELRLTMWTLPYLSQFSGVPRYNPDRSGKP